MGAAVTDCAAVDSVGDEPLAYLDRWQFIAFRRQELGIEPAAEKNSFRLSEEHFRRARAVGIPRQLAFRLGLALAALEPRNR